MDDKQVVGNWKKEKILGTGGFGTVVLWINMTTKAPLALKECRWGQDAIMTTKHRQRWKLEVDIMRRLSHQNVVKAVAVPPELDAPPGSTLPLMAMEYCSGGDLRKVSHIGEIGNKTGGESRLKSMPTVWIRNPSQLIQLLKKALSRPENCCGLPEPQVRTLLRHVVSAVRYLHSMRIIHRDLKPENIVLQENSGKPVYKLIDLGYAKELDQGSLCTSFVGTLQYLAPELFLSQTYSCTVDFWSLGLVAHEVMTGQRPFLPTMSPAQWIPVVRFKSSDDINAYVNEQNRVEFSTEICPFHQISMPFKKDIEDWLRVMLEFEPDKRGRRDGIMGFDIFDRMINKKNIQVFCLDTLQMLNFDLNEHNTVEDLQNSLSMESSISVASQLLLLPKGIATETSQRADSCLVNLEEDDSCPLFLLSEAPSSGPLPSAPSVDIPANVEKIMRQPREPMAFENQRVAWREAIFYSQQLLAKTRRLVQGYKTCLLHLLRRNSCLHKTCSAMQTEIAKLKAKSELFNESLQLDLKFLQEKATSCEHFQTEWKKSLRICESTKKLSEKASSLEGSCNNANTKILEPQKSPYARTKHSDLMNENFNQVVSLFGKLKKKSRDQRSLKCDNSEMVRHLCGCIQLYETQSKDILNHIRVIGNLRQEINVLVPQLDEVLCKSTLLVQELGESQLERQKNIWSLVGHRITAIPRGKQPFPRDANDNSVDSAFEQTYNDTKDSPINKARDVTQPKRVNPFTTERNAQDDNCATSGPLTFILGSSKATVLPLADQGSLQDWSLLLMESAKSSQRVRKENSALRNSLGSMLTTLSRQQEVFLEEDLELLSVLRTHEKTKA